MSEIQPVRIQRSRQHKQVSPNGLPIVYVGRPSKYGNPFRVEYMYKTDAGIKLYGVKTSDENCVDILINNCRPAYELKRYAMYDAVMCFYLFVKDKPFKQLEGKNLSCWCKKNEHCHADILIELANL